MFGEVIVKLKVILIEVFEDRERPLIYELGVINELVKFSGVAAGLFIHQSLLQVWIGLDYVSLVLKKLGLLFYSLATSSFGCHLPSICFLSIYFVRLHAIHKHRPCEGLTVPVEVIVVVNGLLIEVVLGLQGIPRQSFI